jgi:hypothetical protein
MTTQAQQVPPVEPLDERPAPENSSFAELCLSKLSELPVTKGLKLGAPRVTLSDRWGLICRVGPAENDPTDLRIICWQSPDGDWKIMFACVPRETDAR